MKVLVTGGTGFIGSFVVEKLLANGHEIVVIANGRQLPNYFNSLINKVSFFQADFGDIDSLDKILPGCQAVIHIAWSTVPKQTKGSTAFEFSSNIISSIQLLEKCIDHTIDKFVFVSSGGTVYGIPHQIPIPESHVLNPISNYGLSKLTFEKILHLYHHSHQIHYSALRISNAYGERQNLHKNQGVVGVWLKNIIQKGEIEIWGDGSVIRDYIYVQDAATAIVQALHEINGASVFNIGGGQGYSLNTIINEIKKVIARDFIVNYKPARSFDVPENVLDITLARKKLGFSPNTGLSEGIHASWKWISHQLSLQ